MTAVAELQLMDLLKTARHRGASDIHIRAGEAPALRIGGALCIQDARAIRADEVEAMAAFLLTQSDRNTLSSGGGVTQTRDFGDEIGTIRTHAYRSSCGITFAIRLLALCLPRLEDLGLPAGVTEATEQRFGLLLFTGPTGSGKTTALAAFADYINRRSCKHIISLEDPIEYRHRSQRSIITQRTIYQDAGSYAEGVRCALRSDPDVLLIGEMLDADTMHAAITAAETGHLVCATLHTGDAAQTVDRIIGSFTGALQAQMRMQLAATLVGIVCLRLVTRADGSGRRCAAEVLVGSDAVKNVIRDGKTHQLRNVIATSRHLGMITMENHLAQLVAEGQITPRDAALAQC